MRTARRLSRHKARDLKAGLSLVDLTNLSHNALSYGAAMHMVPAEPLALRCRVQGAGCRVQGAGCRVQGAGCRVQGAG